MGFADWGSKPGESDRRRREHEAELETIRREGAVEVAGIHEEVRQSARDHAAYRDWIRTTGRTDVPFEDWKAGRYVHVVIRRKL